MVNNREIGDRNGKFLWFCGRQANVSLRLFRWERKCFQSLKQAINGTWILRIRIVRGLKFTVKLPRSCVLFSTILTYFWLFLQFRCLFYFHASSPFQANSECHRRKELGNRDEYPVFFFFSLNLSKRIWTVTCLNLLFTNRSDVQIF